MPSIRLIRIDDDLRRVVAETSDDFFSAYGAFPGESLLLIREVVSQTLDLLQRQPRSPEWGGYLVADENDSVVIGTCGFSHGPRADGTVEIAYFTFPELEGRGYATAMAIELLRLALKSEASRRVVAHTLPQRNASTRVLGKIGFHLVGESYDADAGRVWLWEYRHGYEGEHHP